MHGHTAGGCRRKDICNICAGPHSMKDCENPIVKCANCDGDHPASSQKCPKNREATKIKKLQNEGLSYTYAKVVVQGKRNNNNFSIPKESTQESTDSNRENPHLYISQNSKESNELYDHQIDKRNFGTQTENLTNSEVTNLKVYVDKIIDNITGKFISFFQEAFSLQLQKENPRERSLLMKNLVKNHFARKLFEEEDINLNEHINEPSEEIHETEDQNIVKSQIIQNLTKLNQVKSKFLSPCRVEYDEEIDTSNEDDGADKQQSQIIQNRTKNNQRRSSRLTQNRTELQDGELNKKSKIVMGKKSQNLKPRNSNKNKQWM